MNKEIQSRTQLIIEGLHGQNDQAKFDGQMGFWCQADAVFVTADTPHDAIRYYRERVAEARIAINHNHFCGDIRAAKLNEENNAISQAAVFEHERMRRELWVKAASSADLTEGPAKIADAMLAAFDKRFPKPI